MSAWESFVARYGVGDVLSGRVTQVLPFGAFVEVADGVVGFFSDRSVWPGAPERAPAVGSRVPVRVVAVDGANQRVSLVTA